MPENYLAGVLFVVLTILLMTGFPVTFVLMGCALLFGVMGSGFEFFHLLPMRIWGIMSNVLFIAVPLFVFMGVMMERSGLAEELLETMGRLFGRLRGGLAISVVVVGALLAATTGVVGATVVTLGLLALPTMLRHNYQKELSTGTVAASGTLGQIIPPSVILVLLGTILQLPVGDLFMAAVIPGLVLVTLFIIYIFILVNIKKDIAPPIPKGDLAGLTAGQFAWWAVKCLIPPLFLIVIVLGSIFAGVASPTEAAGVGSVGSVILAAANRKLTFSALREAMETTTKLTCMVFIILVGAAAFGLTFRELNGDDLIRSFLLYFAHLYSPEMVLLMVMIAIFLMGFVLDNIEIIFIYVPVLAPILIEEFHFDPVWICILIAVNLQTSFLTPPFGFTLFYLKGVTPPGVKTGHIYKGVIPFIVLQLLGLLMLAIWPGLATWLPKLIYGN